MEQSVLSAHARLVLRAALDNRARALEHVDGCARCPNCRHLAARELERLLEEVVFFHDLIVADSSTLLHKHLAEQHRNAHTILDLARRA